MLIDNKGRVYDPKKLPQGRKAREAVIAGLREVFPIQHRHADLFKLQKRARLS